MRIAICDDEEIIARDVENKVKSVLSVFGGKHETNVFTVSEEFEKVAENYDIVFLDYQFPETNGLDIAKRLRDNGNKITIVFLTAYSDYVYDSFEVNTFRYILKPVDEEKIKNVLVGYFKSHSNSRRIEIPVNGSSVFVNENEIMYIESCGRHTIIRLTEKTVESIKSISDFEKEINDFSFFRTHRTYILNLRYITEIQKNMIIISNGEKILISRSNIQNFNKCFNDYLKYS